LGRLFLNGCLLVALTVLFVSKVFPPEAHAYNGAKETHPAFNTYTAHGLGAFYRNPVSPKDNGLVFETITEPEDSIHNLQMLGLVCLVAYLILVSDNLLLDKKLSALPTPFFQNRDTVPLFVLHHSWKNFPH